ncbi:DUF4019 domain-containing protein [Variovorax terrae]|uniref:DUF4019 domain-containing protein n=1 Tax=Variovorax terrae TaxID=2923278 RepID=A0A9X1VY15_9BURK|nr:DUF4019 domain-containing protein [Variovorax terrae]MCJ0764117.1 DUF4019 domain-containing protein [Variovorax terrae]
MNFSAFCLALPLSLSLLSLPAAAQLKMPSTSPSASAPAAPAADNATAAATAEKEAAGLRAAANWLLLLDTQSWNQAWQQAGQLFRSTIPLAQWTEGIPKARAPLGALQERQPETVGYKTQLPGRPDGEYVTVVFASKFANKPDAEEIVTMARETDGQWRVTGYAAR